MKPPKNSKEVSKFLGMAGWYQKFIPQYADICEPLYRLKKKGAKFNWSTEAQDSFYKIKRALTVAPVLKLPNFTEQFNLFTNASGVGIGAVLNQNHRPIAFASRTLNKAERNYTVTERECLAVIWALNKFKTYFGSLPVKVITDHAALTKLTNGKNLSSRMFRWALKLSEFNIEWEHRPGVQNVVADVLSRNPVGNLDGSQILCAALRALALNSREQLIREQKKDPELGHIYRYLKNRDDGSVNATVCEEGAEYVGRNIEKLFDEARQNMRKQHKRWEKYYNRKRREVNIKVNDLVLVRTHFISAAGRRVIGKFMPKFEGPYRVLEVRNNNLIILKRGKKVTVNIDQVRVYRPRQSDTISSDTHVETLYEGQRSSDRSSRSQPGKFKGSRKTSSEQSNGHKSSKGNAGWEDLRLKRKVESNGSGDRKNLKRQDKTPTVASRHEGSGQYNKARETKTTKNGTNRAAERRTVRSKQTTAVRPCPYYLRSRVRQPEGFPEERRNSGIESIPQSNIRRSLSMEALDGVPVIGANKGQRKISGCISFLSFLLSNKWSEELLQ
ncbi:retrovirus-related Pol polyprotein from transposon 17.6 [Trichonephila clavipes]|nr:retrovirus-related Pol polyprotein from transposon 17.6 [Trichonephila clavipes]